MTVLDLWINSDTVIQLEGLKDTITQEYITDATITFTLKDADGNVVSGAEGITMAYQAGTNGDYYGIVEEDVVLVEGDQYWCEISISASGDRKDFRKCDCKAQYRGVR